MKVGPRPTSRRISWERKMKINIGLWKSRITIGYQNHYFSSPNADQRQPSGIILWRNCNLSLIGVKRHDVAENAPASDKLLWLRIERKTMEISQLVFRPMDADSTVQERYLEQGLLKFGSTIGPYMEKNSISRITRSKFWRFRPSLSLLKQREQTTCSPLRKLLKNKKCARPIGLRTLNRKLIKIPLASGQGNPLLFLIR